MRPQVPSCVRTHKRTHDTTGELDGTHKPMALKIVYSDISPAGAERAASVSGWLDTHLSFTWDARVKLYQMIAVRMGWGISTESVLALYARQMRRRGKRSVPNILDSVRTRMDTKGLSFAEAIRPYVPADEYMMIVSGDKANDLPGALDLVCDVKTRIRKIMRAVRSALYQPASYLGVIVASLYIIANWVVPSLVMTASTMKTDDTSLHILILASGFATGKMAIVSSATITTLLVALWLSLTRLTGPVRVFLERLPPWSTYRNVQGYVWLSGFIALVRAGMPDTEALQHQADTATPWLRERLDAILLNLGPQGRSLPEAMAFTGYNFPSPEMIDDIEASWGGKGAYDRLLKNSQAWADTLEQQALSGAARARSIFSIVRMLLAGGLAVGASNVGTGAGSVGGM